MKSFAVNSLLSSHPRRPIGTAAQEMMLASSTLGFIEDMLAALSRSAGSIKHGPRQWRPV
ncbi:MAG: hypothetical protein WA624_00745 [Methylocella sp.]